MSIKKTQLKHLPVISNGFKGYEISAVIIVLVIYALITSIFMLLPALFKFAHTRYKQISVS